MVDAHLLPGEFRALAPHEPVAEVLGHVAVDLVAHVLYGRAVFHYHRLLVVGLAAFWAHVNPDKVQPLVHRFL